MTRYRKAVTETAVTAHHDVLALEHLTDREMTCIEGGLRLGAFGGLRLDGIDGEAQDKDHKGWSDVSSLQYFTR